MRNLIESITQKDFVRATEIFEESIKPIVEKKLFEKKKMYAAKLSLRTAEEKTSDPAKIFRLRKNK